MWRDERNRKLIFTDYWASNSKVANATAPDEEREDRWWLAFSPTQKGVCDLLTSENCLCVFEWGDEDPEVTGEAK